MEKTKFSLNDMEQLSLDEMKNTNGGAIPVPLLIVGGAFCVCFVLGFAGGFCFGGY